MTRHIMLDIETLGTAPGAMIAAIGACSFGHAGPRATFYQRAELRGQDRLGLTADPDTLLWWLRQDDAARGQLTSGVAPPLAEALQRFHFWLLHHDALDADRPELRIWCNGATFDAPLLDAALRAIGQPSPWRYHQVRCHRTLLDLADVDGKAFRPTVPHHALYDAIAQAHAAEAAFRKLGLLPAATEG